MRDAHDVTHYAFHDVDDVMSRPGHEYIDYMSFYGGHFGNSDQSCCVINKTSFFVKLMTTFYKKYVSQLDEI